MRPDLTDVLPERGRAGTRRRSSYGAARQGRDRAAARARAASALGSGRSIARGGVRVSRSRRKRAARDSCRKPDPAHGDRVTTTLELPLVALPPKAGAARAHASAAAGGGRARERRGRDALHARASRSPSRIPRRRRRTRSRSGNPPPRAQREEWTALEARRDLRSGRARRRRAPRVASSRAGCAGRKPVPPPPPPRPPWEVAFEKLDEVRHAGLLDDAALRRVLRSRQRRHAPVFRRALRLRRPRVARPTRCSSRFVVRALAGVTDRRRRASFCSSATS